MAGLSQRPSVSIQFKNGCKYELSVVIAMYSLIATKIPNQRSQVDTHL